jgi:hypothetical protein
VCTALVPWLPKVTWPPGEPFSVLAYEVRGADPVGFLPPKWSWHTAQDGDTSIPNEPVQSLNAEGRGREVHWIEDAKGVTVAAAECQTVYTLAYRGLWLEKLWASSSTAMGLVARAVIERAKAMDLDEVGYLAPRESSSRSITARITPLLREGYRGVGGYYVFTAGAA